MEFLEAESNASNNSLLSTKVGSEMGTNEFNPPDDSPVENSKACLPLTSDSDTSTLSKETKSSNILISCVGRRSKRRKKKKLLSKKQKGETHLEMPNATKSSNPIS